MKGLKIIPVFAVLLLCTYVGIQFVEQNRDTVVVQFWSFQARPSALGLVVLTSVLIGMILAGALCSIELMVLVMQNRSLRRRVPAHKHESEPARAATPAKEPLPKASDETTGSYSEEEEDAAGGSGPKSNRFTPL